MILANMLAVAQQRGDAQLVSGFLNLLHQLAGKAPCGMRPMLENLYESLTKLTLGGLHRWVMWGKEPVSEPYHYDEWDYHIQLARPEWATVIERPQPKADPDVMDEILITHKPIAARIRHLIDAMQPQRIVRRRGYEEAEELDLNAAACAVIDIRRGIMPDPRINIRITRHIRDLSIMVLMDPSQLTSQKVGFEEGDAGYGYASSILDLTREAIALLAWAIDSNGDNFAIHGFASDGRHDVQYYRFKDLKKPYADDAKARLILLITDGQPADIDERDPQYLRHDTKKAVDDLAMRGIYTYCLTLDPDADRYVARIFGENIYSIVDNVERLPERLPDVVVAALTG